MIGKKKNKKQDEEVKAFLGNGTEFDGKLIFTGSVRVDGRFKGEIYGGGGVLISGEGSRIEGTIAVDNIIISGDVIGTLEVKDKAEIYSRGRFFGTMKASKLIVQDGAVLEGNCQMRHETGGIKDIDDV